MARATTKTATKTKTKAAPSKAKAKAAPVKEAKGKTKSVPESKHKIPKSDKSFTPLMTVDLSVENPRALISEFHVAKINKIEASTHMISNIAKYLRPMSTGYLTLDWLFGGGIFNVFASVSGPEQSSKSTFVNNVIASGVRSRMLFNMHIDAEATINAEYAAAMFAMHGVNYESLQDLAHRPYRYYRENVIETAFDFMHQILKSLPQKVWIPQEESWAYLFEKRNPEHAKMMEAYGVKAHKTLNTDDRFVCLTDYDGIEAGFYPDSFAAMVSIDDDDDDKKTRRRAVEASAFSNHLRRISARLTNRGCMMLGTNQLRLDPNARAGYSGPTYREPGGEALKFYTAQRGQFMSVMSGFFGSKAEWNKELKGMAEPSVIVDGAFDLYDYKSVKNTKNKPGNPNKQSYVRIWKADHLGMGHGYDPAYDVYTYLTETRQLKKVKNGRALQFNLRKSVGSKRAGLLNSLPPFGELDLKRLVLSEVFVSRELTSKALENMGLTRTVGLRDALFEQIATDKKVLARHTSKKVKDEDEDVEATSSATEY